MKRDLGEVSLKNGALASTAVIETPDDDWANRLTALLGHKGDPWVWHVREAFAGKCKPQTCYFYVVLVSGEPVANIMIAKYKSVGMFGHVFTEPKWRRHGMASVLSKLAVRDFADIGGAALWLSTGFESHAYRIYESQGFRSIRPGSGSMIWEKDSGAVDAMLRTEPSEIKISPLGWEHWPGAMGLMANRHGDYLRSVHVSCYGQDNPEGGFLRMQKERLRSTHFSGVVAETPQGFVVGWAICAPNPWWPNAGYCLDFYTHPRYTGMLKSLLDAVELPDGKVQVFADGSAVDRIAFCKLCGFKLEAVLRNQFRVDDHLFHDMVILQRS